MATIKSSFLNLVVTLTIVTLVASLALGYVYEWTKEPIAKAQMEKQLKAIESVMNGYDNNPVLERYRLATPDGRDSLDVFPAKNKGELIGVAIKTKSSKGYAGDIWLMIGFSMKGEIQNIFVLEHKETPGLGSKIATSKFLLQFIGRDPVTLNLRVKKDGGDVDAITGATISSRAFSEAVQRAAETFKNSMHHGATN